APSVDAEVVFAGYALTVPEMQYDDLAGLDLRGKIVLYINGGPASIPGPLRSHYQFAAERGKFLERAGAIGTIGIPNPHHMDLPWQRIALGSRQASMSLADPALEPQYGLKFSAAVNPEQAEKWFAGSGHSFDDLVALADAGKPLPRFPLHASIRAKVAVERGEVESQNVAGILPGADPVLKDQYVVLTAHLDRFGIGGRVQAEAAPLAAVRGGDGRGKGAAGVQIFRRAPHGEAGQHGGRSERGYVSAAVPAAQCDGVRAERIGFGRGNPRGGESARCAHPGRPGAGAQHFHPQRPVQLHPAWHPRTDDESGI